MTMDRRKFMQVSAAGIFGLAVEGKIHAFTGGMHGKERTPNGDYSLVILGDTHFDAAPDELYHDGYTDPSPTREANHRKEFVRNYEMWEERMPRLVKRASCLIEDDTKAVLHMGDLIQGDCNSVAAHTRMLDDAMNRLKGILGPLPLVTVAGNHDMRGSRDAEAIEAYNTYMPERMSRELGKKFTKTTFGFNIGPDAFIVVNFNQPDDAEIEKILRETEGARYTFVMVHGPVFPYQSSNYNWILHGKDDAKVRKHIRSLFAKRNAIVFCGHTHTTELADWYGEGGRITQMTMNSVWKDAAVGKYTVEAEGPENYDLSRIKAAEKAGTARPEDEVAMFNEIKPGLKKWIISKACGSYKVRVSDEGVVIDFYAGDDSARSERFMLR